MFYLHTCGIHPTVKTVGFLPKNVVNSVVEALEVLFLAMAGGAVGFALPLAGFLFLRCI